MAWEVPLPLGQVQAAVAMGGPLASPRAPQPVISNFPVNVLADVWQLLFASHG